MPTWAAVLIFFGIFIAIPICLMALAWRRGMRASFLFSYEFVEIPALFAFLYLVLGPTIDWFMGREVDLMQGLRVAAIVSIVYVACFTLGFIRGRVRDRKYEGIVGQRR